MNGCRQNESPKVIFRTIAHVYLSLLIDRVPRPCAAWEQTWLNIRLSLAHIARTHLPCTLMVLLCWRTTADYLSEHLCLCLSVCSSTPRFCSLYVFLICRAVCVWLCNLCCFKLTFECVCLKEIWFVLDVKTIVSRTSCRCYILQTDWWQRRENISTTKKEQWEVVVYKTLPINQE